MAARPPLSPSRSPTGRLPSPPPMAEDQSAPQSPHATGVQDAHTLLSSQVDTQAASRRIRPGTKGIDMAEGPPLVELSEIDSPFQLTEHLKSLHYSYTHPSSSDFIIPLTKQLATELSQPPLSIDRTLWLYELCRFLVQKVNSVIVGLFADNPACSAQTCPEMRASEWQYLCAVHDPPKACCAIDYCCHTLDWAANTLTSPKHFPSRLSLGTENAAPQHQLRQLTNIFRRVYRIFAHAWFSHRDMFWRMEGKTGLYVFFKTVCDTYNLIPEDNYTIPPEAEGKEPSADRLNDAMNQSSPLESQPLPPSILKRPGAEFNDLSADSEDLQSPSTVLAPGATARRHRHSPSKGAPVGTVMEENEEETPHETALLPGSVAALIEEDKTLPELTRADTQIPAGSALPLTATPVTSADLEQSQTALPTFASQSSEKQQSLPLESSEADLDQNAPHPLVSLSESASATSPVVAQAPADPATTATTVTVSPIVTGAPPPAVTETSISASSTGAGSKSYSGFSPASPKASTFEELELAGEQQMQAQQQQQQQQQQQSPSSDQDPKVESQDAKDDVTLD